jgi:hypothetical protein
VISITGATTESTLLRDIETAIHTQRADDPVYRVKPIAHRAANLFARINGWRWDPSFRFQPESLGKRGNDYEYQRPYWCDHALYFRGLMEDRRGWVNIAIAGQPYAGAKETIRPELEELARRGFCISTPPSGERASIWFPGQTLFIVVTLPGVRVRWLPEQGRSV